MHKKKKISTDRIIEETWVTHDIVENGDGSITINGRFIIGLEDLGTFEDVRKVRLNKLGE